MNQEELRITIDAEGRVLLAVSGVPGEGCLATTKALENALGCVLARDFSPEYYEQETRNPDLDTLTSRL